jgi:hypothetical protein
MSADQAEAIIRRQQRYIEELESIDAVGLKARADKAEAHVDRVRELLTKWVDEYGDPVYRGNGWAEGVRDAAREALKALDGEQA